MANREKGEASFECDGRRYTLVLGLHAWSEAQDVLATGDRKVQSHEVIARKMTEGSTKHLIAMFYGMLRKHHPEINTLVEASELLEQAGAPAVKAMGLAFGLSKADVADVKEMNEGAKGNPQPAQTKRARGRSISKLAATA